MEWSLIGKVLGNKLVSRDGLEGILRKVWKVLIDLKWNELGPIICLFFCLVM